MVFFVVFLFDDEQYEVRDWVVSSSGICNRSLSICSRNWKKNNGSFVLIDVKI